MASAISYAMAKRTRQGNPKVAVGYLRVSTDEQTLGPDAQRAAIEAWAARQGVTVTAWHQDSVTGASELDARPGLIAALGELRACGAGVLVVMRRDRLARDVAIAAAIERAVESCGARVQQADGTANGSTPADEFLRTILDAAAAYERALIIARTKAALAVKQARGERTGGIPYGYQVGEDGKRLEPLEAEQAVIRIAHDLHGQGMSVRTIAARLAEQGVTSRKGTPLSFVQVHRMLAA